MRVCVILSMKHVKHVKEEVTLRVGWMEKEGGERKSWTERRDDLFCFLF